MSAVPLLEDRDFGRLYNFFVGLHINQFFESSFVGRLGMQVFIA